VKQSIGVAQTTGSPRTCSSEVRRFARHRLNSMQRRPRLIIDNGEQPD
jgi:hypothetical protein